MSREKPMAVNMASRGETNFPSRKTGPEMKWGSWQRSPRKHRRNRRGLCWFFSCILVWNGSVVRRFGRLEKKWDFEHVDRRMIESYFLLSFRKWWHDQDHYIGPVNVRGIKTCIFNSSLSLGNWHSSALGPLSFTKKWSEARTVIRQKPWSNQLLTLPETNSQSFPKLT